MALRSQIAPNDCIDQYEKSAAEHRDAGVVLLSHGLAQGISLMALSAEMLLKAAYFRIAGFLPTWTISRTELADAERDLRRVSVTRSAEGIVKVKRQGLPARNHSRANSSIRMYPAIAADALDAADETELLQRAARLETNWSIGDRYKALQSYANKQDMEDVLDDAVGIAELYQQGRI